MRKITAPPTTFNSTIAGAPHDAQRRVTSYDVARLAGVSQSAVSRCFKPGASVSKSTHARVMKAAQFLDYIPNAAARSLITRRSNLVAVIISNLANLHYPQALSELSQQLARHGKRVLLFTLDRESDIERALADVWQHQVDGVVSAVRLLDEQLSEFERRGLPLVLLNRYAGGHAVSSVVCDQGDAGRQMVTRLAAAGHRQFAIIDGPNESVVAQERKRGALEVALELGLPLPIVVSGNYDYASGGRGLRCIIERLGRIPDAVMCGNDVTAFGCLDTARHELGIDVPRQMSVVGFDALEASTWLSYKLTTLHQPIRTMALAAADILAAMIDKRDGQIEHRVMRAQFVEGATARLHSHALAA